MNDIHLLESAGEPDPDKAAVAFLVLFRDKLDRLLKERLNDDPLEPAPTDTLPIRLTSEFDDDV